MSNTENDRFAEWNGANIEAKYSDGISPYQKYLDKNDINEEQIMYYYTYGNYSILIDGQIHWFIKPGLVIIIV